MRNRLQALILFLLFAFIRTDGWGMKGAGSGTSTDADPHIIDDFSGNAIDTAKWTLINDQAGPDVFSQSGGFLKFSATAGAGTLQSAQPCGPGFYTMRFYDYSSTNSEEPGSHRGAFVGLGLGPQDNFVRIIRCQNGQVRRSQISYIGVFEANYIDNTRGGIRVFCERTEVSAGRLGLYYDGRKVTFYFNPDPNAETGWRRIKKSSGGDVLEWNPHWTEPPSLFIRGFDPSGTTRFKVDRVEYRPGPPEAN